MTGSRDHIKLAQQYFQLVGASPSECDTIPGLDLRFRIWIFRDVDLFI